ncbi:MAG: chemotaxis response regulator protein-glutamate methylesterase [Spirochaetales bacterium]|nr:chemotaxis response regulator protein-glutamate methylesterase [Spirochaetales bacterium]
MSIKVLAVDDSALVRKMIGDILEEADGIELVATAYDPIFAVEKLKKHPIDVIILDIEMPKMDGLTFLEKLMKVRPTPVIILSSLSKKNALITMQAFELGAFEVLEKTEDLFKLTEMKDLLINTIKNASVSDVRKKLASRFQHSRESSPRAPQKLFTQSRETTDKIIVIGSSTGGTTAVADILAELPADTPGVVVVQHLPRLFSQSFADRLNTKTHMTVKLAEHDEIIKTGFVYVAPGDIHCSIKASGAKYLINLRDGPRVNYHKPSVTVLFNSVANFAGKNSIGIMLTGMGDDGAMAMKKMKDAGSYNIVQDRDTSIVWGMPGKAFEYGAASVVSPLEKIPEYICKFLNGKRS